MKLNKNDLLLYPIIGKENVLNQDLLSAIEAILSGGAKVIQLREKNMPDEEFIAEAQQVKRLCEQYHSKLIINDNLIVAKAVQADGVHIGQDDASVADVKALLGEKIIIGLSVNNVDEAKQAVKEGVDYLGVGAMYATKSKSDAHIVTMDELQLICQSVELPVVAIGGINQGNIKNFKDVNIAGIAMISALLDSDNIQENIYQLKREIEYYLKNKIHTTLTIAGSDSSGGAGIQADLKTMLANGVYGMSVISAITAQNTQKVQAVFDLSSDLVESQLQAVFEDIYPESVKIGMVSNVDIINTIVKILKKYSAHNIVVDPVMVSTSGCVLISDEAIKTLQTALLPLASLITPNIYEAEILSGMAIKNAEDMEKACQKIYQTIKCPILLKGGHCVNDANDVLYDGVQCTWFKGEHIANDNTHGTGCTLSSAIASNLAKGHNMIEAITLAKQYLSDILKSDIDLGMGSGPLNHGYQGVNHD